MVRFSDLKVKGEGHRVTKRKSISKTMSGRHEFAPPSSAHHLGNNQKTSFLVFICNYGQHSLFARQIHPGCNNPTCKQLIYADISDYQPSVYFLSLLYKRSVILCFCSCSRIYLRAGVSAHSSLVVLLVFTDTYVIFIPFIEKTKGHLAANMSKKIPNKNDHILLILEQINANVKLR